MLTLIITKANTTQEFELSSSFNKENLQDITSISFQDDTQTVHIEVKDNSFEIFSKITDILISQDIQNIKSLQSFLQEVKEEDSEDTALQELQELLKDSSLNFETLSLDNAQAQGNDQQSSVFIDQSEEDNIEAKEIEERTTLEEVFEEDIVLDNNISNKSNQSEENALLSPSISNPFTPLVPVITDIIDTNGDFSNIIMTGEGENAGNIVTLYDEDSNTLATTLVTSSLTWSFNITSLSDTPINDNEFFKVTQENIYGLTSDYSEATHFNHYNWTNAQTDNFDDYALAGSGNDRLLVNDDDLNDRVVADGGDGVDKLVFSGNKEDYTITHQLDGTVSILEDSASDSNGDGIGDETIARNVEELEFANGSIFTNTLVSPIAFDLNNDGIISVTGETSSLNKDLNATIGETVKFDINFDGIKDTIEWFDGSGDGILIDNKDGLAMSDMDGSRLFGDENGTYANGYEKLNALDINNDGKLSNKELDGLNIWIDDGDAQLEEGELKTLDEVNIESISTQMSEVLDEDGKTHMQSLATKTNGEEILSEDVWFTQKISTSEQMDTIDLQNINETNIKEQDSILNKETKQAEEMIDNEEEIFVTYDKESGTYCGNFEDDGLIIFGNSEENILLEGGIKTSSNQDGAWEKVSKTQDEEGNTFNTYQGSNNNYSIKLLIEEEIDINNI